MDESESEADRLFMEWLASASESIAPASHSDEGVPADEADDGGREDDDDAYRDERSWPPMLPRSVFSPHVPDLTRIPEERWEEALLPYPVRLRHAALMVPGLSYETTEAWHKRVEQMPPSLADTIGRPPQLRRRSGPLEPFRRAHRQVNVRLTDEEHELLRRAAISLGATPTQVARMLIVGGVREAALAVDRAAARTAAELAADDG